DLPVGTPTSSSKQPARFFLEPTPSTRHPHPAGTARWRELTDTLARDWPGHPEPLDDRDVLQRLETLAAQVAGPSPSIRRQVMEDAPGVILQAFASFQRSRPFNP